MRHRMRRTYRRVNQILVLKKIVWNGEIQIARRRQVAHHAIWLDSGVVSIGLLLPTLGT